jgi:hypothetical protein
MASTPIASVPCCWELRPDRPRERPRGSHTPAPIQSRSCSRSSPVVTCFHPTWISSSALCVSSTACRSTMSRGWRPTARPCRRG